MAWPSYFPPEGCPPQSAKPPHGRVYRLLKKGVVTEEEFVSKKQKQPDRVFENDCLACGLSCAVSKDGVKKLKKRFKGWSSSKVKIASAILPEECGVIKHTGKLSDAVDDHHTLWVCDSYEIYSFFSIEPEE